MNHRTDPDPEQVGRLLKQWIAPRGRADAPLVRFAYLEDREALLESALTRVRREKYAMVAEAVAAGMSYRAVADRIGVSLARVQRILKQAQETELQERVGSDA